MRITGIDEDKSGIDDGPSYRYLDLDIAPDEDWKEFFNITLRQFIHTYQYPPVVSGSTIKIYCPMDDLQEHIIQLKEAVSKANSHYNDLLAEREENRRKEAEALQKKKSHAKAFYGSLKF